jgi:hypothetical protein
VHFEVSPIGVDDACGFASRFSGQSRAVPPQRMWTRLQGAGEQMTSIVIPVDELLEGLAPGRIGRTLQVLGRVPD